MFFILVADTMRTKLNFRHTPKGTVVTLSDGTVIALGLTSTDDVWELNQFNLKERRLIFSVELKDVPTGFAKITLGGKPTIAIAYG